MTKKRKSCGTKMVEDPASASGKLQHIGGSKSATWNSVLTQGDLGEKMHARQATVSKLEAGEPATQIRILMDALAALDLELVIRPRTRMSAEAIKDLF